MEPFLYASRIKKLPLGLDNNKDSQEDEACMEEATKLMNMNVNIRRTRTWRTFTRIFKISNSSYGLRCTLR
jgi:hypothetical protein